MSRWGCETSNTTFMCKWCGTWFCRECRRGAFRGYMSQPLKCRVCFQKRCQGTRVDVIVRPANIQNGDADRAKGSNNSSGKGSRRSTSSSKMRLGAGAMA